MSNFPRQFHYTALHHLKSFHIPECTDSSKRANRKCCGGNFVTHTQTHAPSDTNQLSGWNLQLTLVIMISSWCKKMCGFFPQPTNPTPPSSHHILTSLWLWSMSWQDFERLAAQLDGAKTDLTKRVNEISLAAAKEPIVKQAELHAQKLSDLANQLERYEFFLAIWQLFRSAPLCFCLCCYVFFLSQEAHMPFCKAHLPSLLTTMVAYIKHFIVCSSRVFVSWYAAGPVVSRWHCLKWVMFVWSLCKSL